LLARPGEAIYNDSNGAVEGNNPFQAAWVSDETRDAELIKIAQLAKDRGFEPPDRQIVFEGNVPADVDLNHLLNKLLQSESWPEEPKSVMAWLGDAIAIKDPTSAVFRRQSGSNLMVVGQRDEAALAMLVMSIIGIAAQHAPDRAKFYIMDGSPADSPGAGYLASLSNILPHEIVNVDWREVEDRFAEIGAECERRQAEDDTTAPAIYLIIFGLQRYRMLRQSDDFSFSMDAESKTGPDKHFANILREGPVFGIHCLLWGDTLTNLERVVDRSSLREIDHRALFQRSAQDSTNLIDTPAASKMGMQRALLFNEEHGQSEKFRPYALPQEHWLETVKQQLESRSQTVQES
ncbi:MAG: cell division protein FtsK, partial [Planctomycetota bacterium]|nr:cell division protein FtsK [Planctomycetota bacterium]